VKVVGRRLEPDDYRLRDFLTRAAQPHEWYEAGTPEADAALAAAGAEGAPLPVVIDGDTLHPAATVERLAEAWRVFARPKRTHYDLFVVGAGPAGLAAAVYGASDGLSTAVAEADVPGGQASHTSMIENFFGFVEGIGGAELARLAGRQAERFGAELLILNGVVDSRLHPDKPPLAVLSSGEEVTAEIALVAPGMDWRRLDVGGVDELLGHGVYYGAGRSEAVQCSGEHVMVVGAGNSAGQAVMNLASAGARVTMVVRGESLRKSMSAYLVDRVEATEAIDVRLRAQVRELHE
jgi:thioredoxin reductase (NADPH)